MEEASGRLLYDSEQKVSVTVSQFLGDVTVQLVHVGDALNPLEDSPFPEEDQQDLYQGRILGAYRGITSYSRRNRRNVVTFTAHSSANKQVRYTIIAMILGVLAGLAMKYLLPGHVLSFVNVSILMSIRAMFLNALKMMIAPLVFFSVVTSIAGLGSISAVGRSGGKVMLFYTVTSILAALLGTGLFYLFFHGAVPRLDLELNAAGAVEATEVDLISIVKNVIPSNLVSPILNMDMLQVLFVSILFGAALNILRDQMGTVRQFSTEMNLLCTKIVNMIVRFLPLVAFVSVASLMIRVGGRTMLTLGMILLGHILGMTVMTILYGLMILLAGKISPMPFWQKVSRFMPIPFSVCSSNACIPLTMDFCEHKMGVPPDLSSFSIPVGSTINMDGVCMSIVFQGLLLAKMSGLSMTPGRIVLVILTSLLLSVGAPGVAGSAFICLTTIVVTLGLPAETATFVLGIDSILTMFRVTHNVVGDIAATTAVAASERVMDREAYCGTGDNQGKADGGDMRKTIENGKAEPHCED
ncbi:MAG: dicarboxylate/amino acid:cation symporter [Ruminococcaceae bacterium]|nr:dicarboxylate/amino acid:cation symporter [Oscillospiraceae bacterium]